MRLRLPSVMEVGQLQFRGAVKVVVVISAFGLGGLAVSGMVADWACRRF